VGEGPKNAFNSLVTGGQVSRVDPESTGLNPVWRNSLAYTVLSRSWQDGANSTEIAAARELLIRDMKILEAIAPESGAYLNEVKPSHLCCISLQTLLNFFFFFSSGLEIRTELEKVILRNALRPAP
jgi:hypothetical protein